MAVILTTCCFNNIFIPSGLCTLPRACQGTGNSFRLSNAYRWSVKTAASSTYSGRQSKSTKTFAACRLGHHKRRNCVKVVEGESLEPVGESLGSVRSDRTDVGIIRKQQRLALPLAPHLELR